MSALAQAYTLTAVEGDPRIVEGLTKECGLCDSDNPRAVPRESCPECRGSGRQSLAIGTIASEISKSRRGLSAVPESDGEEAGNDDETGDSDLYLEY